DDPQLVIHTFPTRRSSDLGKGVVLITPGEQCSYADVYEWQPQIGRPFTYPLFAAPGGRHLEPVQLHEKGLANGAQVWPQVTPRRSEEHTSELQSPCNLVCR